MSGSWHERWVGWRNRLLASARFQHFAPRFPLTRPVAQRRARGLFDLVAGFTYSQVLAACIESDLLPTIGADAVGPEDLAARLDLPVAMSERLARAAASLDLVERVGDRWMLGSTGAALLGNPGIAEMVTHHRLLYADLADPLALFRRGGGGGALQDYWRYARQPGTGAAGEVADYSALMAASQPLVADLVLDAYRFDRHRRLLDVGGGEGAFLRAAARRVPALERGLFDLPAVVDRAAAQRVPASFHRGNFLHDDLPGGYDLVTLVRILHDHDDAPALALLRRVRAALPPGGRLLIAEPMAGTRGAEPMGDAYFGVYLLAMGSGRPRTASELRNMLRQAGFGRVREFRTALPMSVRVLVADA